MNSKSVSSRDYSFFLFSCIIIYLTVNFPKFLSKENVLYSGQNPSVSDIQAYCENRLSDREIPEKY